MPDIRIADRRIKSIKGTHLHHKDIDAMNTFSEPNILNIEYIEDMNEITLEPLSAYVLEISIE